MMPQDYQEVVLEAYKKMRINGELLMLSDPTDANLKKACLKIFDKSYTAQDDDILSSFFNVNSIGIDFRNVISDTKPGTFRALSNHLKGSKARTHERNTDLLAWLIGFEHRPSFRYYKWLMEKEVLEEETETEEQEPVENEIEEIETPATVPINEDEDLSTDNKEEDTENNDTSENTKDSEEVVITTGDLSNNDVEGKEAKGKETPIDEEESDYQMPKRDKIIIVSILVLLVTGFISYSLRGRTEKTSVFNTLFLSGSENCMYWVGDHYERIACDQKGKVGVPVISLDHNKLNNLKRITRPDTLTKNSIGKVWYARFGGKNEFFTDSGTHPVDTAKRLKPITNYIITNHTSYHRFLLWLCGSLVAVAILVGIVVSKVYQYKKQRSRMLSKTKV
ncbi:MAG: hypothetical protein EOO95_00315 [Pedobacter sp.]|nr:MAG: hypothetical protein EOO95_00315 [Pedobacter sp.]